MIFIRGVCSIIVQSTLVLRTYSYSFCYNKVLEILFIKLTLVISNYFSFHFEASYIYTVVVLTKNMRGLEILSKKKQSVVVYLSCNARDRKEGI